MDNYGHSRGSPIAWCQFVSSGLSESSQRLIPILETSGIHLSSQTAADDKPIVFLLEHISHSALDSIREGVHCGRRLMVVAIGSAVTMADRWAVLAAGASDFIEWDTPPVSIPQILSRIDRWHEVERIVNSAAVRDQIVGAGPGWIAMLRQIVEIAALTMAPVLITGESGTGKELIASLIHAIDRRAPKGEFVLLDCTTIVPELAGSEFFGHERGAYTGAIGQRDGAFALAHRGTLFLDEVGELPLTLQASLLRVVQERTYKRVGSNEWRAADFRLVCATNRDLIAESGCGGFRRDLYYRIAACTFHLPPLRDRRDDILPLARHFLRLHYASAEDVDFDGAVCQYLISRDYPGNVRDLKQIVGRMAYRHAGTGRITLGDIPPEDRPSQGELSLDWKGEPFRRSVQRAVSLGLGLKEIGRSAEEVAEEFAVEQENGNLQRAARRLGITDRALQMRRAARRQAES